MLSLLTCSALDRDADDAIPVLQLSENYSKPIVVLKQHPSSHFLESHYSQH